MAWRYVARETGKKFRLVVTGRVSPLVLRALRRLCRRLRIDDVVTFAGEVSRVNRLLLVAKARLMLYPSHVDAFPFAVLEALSLGTPVVAYDIPAIACYYRETKGVHIVRELDIEALAQEAVNTLEGGCVDIDKLQFRSWSEIIAEEASLLKSLVR